MLKIALPVLFILGAPAFADGNPALEAQMKEIGDKFNDIKNNMGDPSQNSVCAADAAQMVADFTAALGEVPPVIDALADPAQKAAALADYAADIQDEIDDAKALQSAFVANDNAGAQALFLKMNGVKNDGHKKYKPKN